MSYSQIFLVLFIGFGLGYVTSVQIDPVLFPQPVKTIEKVVEVPVLPDTTKSLAELVSIAERRGVVDVHFVVKTQAQFIFYTKNLKWLGYETNQDTSSNQLFVKYDNDNKRVKLASVFYAH